MSRYDHDKFTRWSPDTLVYSFPWIKLSYIYYFVCVFSCNFYGVVVGVIINQYDFIVFYALCSYSAQTMVYPSFLILCSYNYWNQRSWGLSIYIYRNSFTFSGLFFFKYSRAFSAKKKSNSLWISIDVSKLLLIIISTLFPILFPLRHK